MPAYKIVSIVPQLPPQVNGVGDYAFYLAQKLKSGFGVETIFIRTDAFSGRSEGTFKEETLMEKTKDSLYDLLESLEANCILLHYVGYAYAPRGCPYWLVQGLEKWKKTRPSVKVIPVFHELYASGKLWESAFWLHYFQKNLVKRLLKISYASIVNSEVTRTILMKFGLNKPVFAIPVFSNIGEITHRTEFEGRDHVMILFGSSEKRTEIYSNSLNSLHRWTEKLNIKKVLEIGPLRKERATGTGSLEIIELGVLSAPEITEIFNRAKYGILQYPLALLSKSGIFAAYAAHGMVPVILGKHFMNFDSNGLKNGVHFLFDPDSELESDQDKISSAVYNWYQGHTLEELSSRVNDIIRQA